MSGSSVGAMIVGTIFIMIFGMATVSMIESIDDSVEVAEYELPNPKIKLTTVTDKQESSGPIDAIGCCASAGTGYTGLNNQQCSLTGLTSGATDASIEIIVVGDEVVGIGTPSTLVPGTGYQVETVSFNCGTNANSATASVSAYHDLNTITITNIGSESVELTHIYITFSDTVAQTQGVPFQFYSQYIGSNLFIFPGEEVSTVAFPLDSNRHGFTIDNDPTRAFLAVYEYSSAVNVTIT